MAILFDFYHSPSAQQEGEEKEERFHARVVSNQTLGLEEMVQNISQRCTLTKGDILAVMGELSDEVANGLLRGKQVNVPGIGLFSLSLKAPRDANPDKTLARHIEVKRVEFRADYQLRQRVKEQAVFERSREKVHSARIDRTEMEALLTEHFKRHAYITRNGFEELCHLTRSTAARHLRRLVAEGRLINTGTRRNPIYELPKGATA